MSWHGAAEMEEASVDREDGVLSITPVSKRNMEEVRTSADTGNDRHAMNRSRYWYRDICLVVLSNHLDCSGSFIPVFPLPSWMWCLLVPCCHGRVRPYGRVDLLEGCTLARTGF